jgi:hypothetical protein
VISSDVIIYYNELVGRGGIELKLYHDNIELDVTIYNINDADDLLFLYKEEK